MSTTFNHFDSSGNAVMVDISEKQDTQREATAVGTILVSQKVLDAILQGTAKKGDVLGVARIAGIMAVKRTAELIPLCHTLPLQNCSLTFAAEEDQCGIKALCTVKTMGKTGVEMEALTGVSVALLTIYDMCKAIDKNMVIHEIHLVEKSGGKSGDYHFGKENQK